MSTWKKRLKNFERRVRTSFGDDISTPKARRNAFWHYHLFDHAFLRTFWTNFAQLAPGVYRSNQPTHARWVRYKRDYDLKAVINLRGADKFSPYLFEKESLEQLGIQLIDVPIYARRPASRDEMLDLIDALKNTPKPFLLHCKSGADRAGLASVLYLHLVEGVPLAQARKQLSWRFLHLKSTMTGAVDFVLDAYEDDTAGSDMSFEDWVATTYDKTTLFNKFKAQRGITD
ncbi:fused DSP-PTPase phosphatase/NAD kinase-like protein [Algirhabdus cladophorae]|uniref:fused DSP-PTPase phosphatase/NAD kinase-like protein n=1 Tax=Algirhabdus cladophorae TaxID=3377108 RepID=UPI003B849AAE